MGRETYELTSLCELCGRQSSFWNLVTDSSVRAGDLVEIKTT